MTITQSTKHAGRFTLHGPGYYVIREGSTPLSCSYIPAGGSSADGAVRAENVIFTIRTNTIGELLELINFAGIVSPAKNSWETVSDAIGTPLYKGLPLGITCFQAGRETEFLRVNAYEYSAILTDTDTGQVDTVALVKQIAYLNLWGLVPCLYAGDLPRSMAEQLLDPQTGEQILNIKDNYPEQAYLGPLSYKQMKHLLHYFFPVAPLLEDNVRAWVVPFLRLRGNGVLSSEDDIQALLDPTDIDFTQPDIDLPT